MDSTTRPELRGITSSVLSKNQGIFTLAENLEMKPRSQLSDVEKIQLFQRKLYLKAKQQKRFRFYVLYDKVCSRRFLKEAYRRVKRNAGKPGVDGVTFEDIEQAGLEQFLAQLQTELEQGTYRPSPILRRMIPKPNGKLRPLGIPTIKDRVAETSCLMVIAPIFEADFEDCSYAYRPKRSVKGAVSEIKGALREGNTEVYDADLSNYFDSIPHDKLMVLLERRISDKRVLNLLRMWLKAPVREEDGRMTGGRSNKQGTPQGGVISPLLANLYLHLVDGIVCKAGGYFAKAGIRIVRYADDFVLQGKRIPPEALQRLQNVLGRMGLTLNREKSRLISAMKEPFDFLGFTFRHDVSIHNWRCRYWNVFPSKKSTAKLRTNLREYFQNNHLAATPELVAGLNSIIRGWVNSYHIGGVSYVRRSCEDVSYYLHKKLHRHYERKSQRACKLYRQCGYDGFVERFKLLDPVKHYMRLKAANA
jgi:RNA-directed DNA polymerase